MNRYAICKRKKFEAVTAQNMALTPSECYKLAEQGIPIGSAILPDNQFYDGDSSQGFFIPLDRMRGVDINIMWQDHENTSKKLGKHMKGVGYGNGSDSN